MAATGQSLDRSASDVPTPRRSPLAMAVLSLLAEQPMHVYRMQQLIRERHQDDVVNVSSRNSVHQVVDRLVRDGLAVERPGEPRRAVYALTPLGARTLRAWFAEMLSRRKQEYPEFPAALAFLALLSPQEVADRLDERAVALVQEIEQVDPVATAAEYELARVFLVEDEYRRAMLEAELVWVRAAVADLRSGDLAWPAAGIRAASED